MKSQMIPSALVFVTLASILVVLKKDQIGAWQGADADGPESRLGIGLQTFLPLGLLFPSDSRGGDVFSGLLEATQAKSGNARRLGTEQGTGARQRKPLAVPSPADEPAVFPGSEELFPFEEIPAPVAPHRDGRPDLG